MAFLRRTTEVSIPQPIQPAQANLRDQLARKTLVTEHPQAELANKAVALLGYDVLANDVGICDKLGVVLKKLEIEPFEPTTVAVYKQAMRQKASYESNFNTVYFKWERVQISDYRKPIPIHVLNKAVQIKEQLPQVEIFIEELTRVPDPFLVVKFGREEFYVEVWDEPKFEQEL